MLNLQNSSVWSYLKRQPLFQAIIMTNWQTKTSFFCGRETLYQCNSGLYLTIVKVCTIIFSFHLHVVKAEGLNEILKYTWDFLACSAFSGLDHFYFPNTKMILVQLYQHSYAGEMEYLFFYLSKIYKQLSLAISMVCNALFCW